MNRFIAIFIGLAVMAGSAAMWHYWNLHGFVAFLFAFFGSVLVERGVGLNKENRT